MSRVNSINSSRQGLMEYGYYEAGINITLIHSISKESFSMLIEFQPFGSNIHSFECINT